MHAMWRRHAPCRMKYQPVEIKMVLTKLSDALIAGRSEIEIISTSKIQRSMPNVQSASAAKKEIGISHGVQLPCLFAVFFRCEGGDNLFRAGIARRGSQTG